MNQSTCVMALLKFHRQCIQSSMDGDKIKLAQCNSTAGQLRLMESIQRKSGELKIFDSAISGIEQDDCSLVNEGLKLLKYRLSISCDLFQKVWDRLEGQHNDTSQQFNTIPLWEKSKSDLSFVDSQLGIC